MTAQAGKMNIALVTAVQNLWKKIARRLVVIAVMLERQHHQRQEVDIHYSSTYVLTKISRKSR